MILVIGLLKNRINLFFKKLIKCSCLYILGLRFIVRRLFLFYNPQFPLAFKFSGFANSFLAARKYPAAAIMAALSVVSFGEGKYRAVVFASSRATAFFICRRSS